MVNSKAKGITTELLCQAYLSSLGYNISVPIGEDCRYDMILDVFGNLLRIQVKTCKENKSSIEFSTHSITTSGKQNVIHKYTKTEIDFFAVYYNDRCYLVPVELCTGNNRSLSFTNIRTNSQAPLFIEDFTAEAVIDFILNGGCKKYIINDFTVYQFDLNGKKVINSFSSYASAGKSIGKKSSHISACARGLRKSAYGYRWSLSPTMEGTKE